MGVGLRRAPRAELFVFLSINLLTLFFKDFNKVLGTLGTWGKRGTSVIGKSCWQGDDQRVRKKPKRVCGKMAGTYIHTQ